MRDHRRAVVALVAAAFMVITGAATSASAAAGAAYTVSVGSLGPWTNPDDSPASTFIDKNGKFYYQQSVADYGATAPRQWTFYTGKAMDDATAANRINQAVNPANPRDKNNDTTWRCNNSPTGRRATYASAGSGYSQRNYCDLIGTWVDPDTGDWIGLVHNEFTPQPFGDSLHYDAIGYAVSTNHGKTWTIKSQVITSPYSTLRGDTAAFPNQTYYYGDGDPRLFVGTASGYFYVYYGSRVVDKSGGWKAFYAHVARAPIADKMAPGSWRKWYDGTWTQPGLGGRESNMVPISTANTTGYTPPAKEYKPGTPGTADQQIAAGQMPPTSPLFVMNITYDAYLGLYIGEPQAVDQSGNAPQQFYATDNLSTQKWQLIGDTGNYTDASWYRWFLDPANRTSSGIVGKTFRSYCSFGCSGGAYGEYANVTIASTRPVAPVVTPGRPYFVASAAGGFLTQPSLHTSPTSVTRNGRSWLARWLITSNKDGSYTITNASTHRALGVNDTSDTGRAWGARTTLTTVGASGPNVGQEWFIIQRRTGREHLPTYELVNRYSGLVLNLSANPRRAPTTVAPRSWVGKHIKQGLANSPAQQQILFIPWF